MTGTNMRLGGVVTFWTLSEWTDLATLKTGLTDAGFEKFVPEQRTPAACLKDAIGDLYTEKDLLIRPLKTKDGFAVVRETRGDNENRFEAVCSAKIHPDTMRITLSPYDWSKAQSLEERYNKFVGLVRPAGVSQSLVNIMGSLNSTRLRPGGGIYWLHQGELPQWQRVIAAVEASSQGKPHAMYVIRHDMDADAVRAVRDAVIEEVTADATRLHAEVTKGDLGERALTHRKDAADLLRSKIALYEELLDTGLESLRSSLDVAEQATMAALMLASGTAAPAA